MTLKRRCYSVLASGLLSAGFVVPCMAQMEEPVPPVVPTTQALHDFDGDGFSDPLIYVRQNDNSERQIQVTRYNSADGSVFQEELGKREDLFAGGVFSQQGLAELVTARTQVDGSISWEILNAEGLRSSRSFGSSANALLGGCDFDGDKLTDFAFLSTDGLHVTSAESGSEWIIPATIAENSNVTDVACADTNGDGSDELVLLEATEQIIPNEPPKYRYTARVLDRSGAELMAIAPRRQFKLVVADYDGDGKDELGTYLTRRSVRPRITIFDEGGVISNIRVTPFAQASAAVVPGAANEPVPGLFLLGKFGEVYSYRMSDASTTLLMSGVSSDVDLLGRSSSIVPVNEEIDAGPEGCSQVFYPDGVNGFLWKESDTQGGLVLIFPEQYTRKFKSVVVSKFGRVLTETYFAYFANGNRQHWRNPSRPAASFPSDSVVVAATPEGNLCWKVARPSNRVD
jgi:hypothetical protein